MKYFISHRGNLNGVIKELENSPNYIDSAIEKGYDVEIDFWLSKDRMLFLGHDNAEHKIDFEWLLERKNKLWIHCKNKRAMMYFNSMSTKFNYFWHDKDDMTLTSIGVIWAYPNKQKIKNSIAVLPELYNDDTSVCLGVCSDFIEKYKNDFTSLRD